MQNVRGETIPNDKPFNYPVPMRPESAPLASSGFPLEASASHVTPTTSNVSQEEHEIDRKDYETLERQIGKRFFCVSKLIKPSRFLSVFDPRADTNLITSAISAASGRRSCQITDSNRREISNRGRNSKQSVFKCLKETIAGRKFRILLVEDNPVNRKVLYQFLDRSGIMVDLVSDGEECVRKVFKNKPGYYDMILCDLHMPRKDGFQTCAEIRTWEQDNDVSEENQCPIIALSANVMADAADKCSIAGFTRYMSKPVDFDLFKGKLRLYC